MNAYKKKEQTGERFFIGVYELGNGQQVLQCSEDKDCLSCELLEYKGEYVERHSLTALRKLLRSIARQNFIDFIEINTNKFYRYWKFNV